MITYFNCVSFQMVFDLEILGFVGHGHGKTTF